MGELWTGDFGVSDEPVDFVRSEAGGVNLRGAMVLGLTGILAFGALWMMGRR